MTTPWDKVVATCDRPGCYLAVACSTIEAAEAVQRDHICPHNGGHTKFAWSITMMLVEQMWAHIDEEYEVLCTEFAGYGAQDALRATQAGKLRGMADMILLFMSPYFSDSDSIVREVVHRRNMRVAGERYETPGLGSRMYEHPYFGMSEVHLATVKAKQAVVTRAQESAGNLVTHGLSNDDVRTIRAAKGTGLVTDEELAQMNGVSVEVIQSILLSNS